MSMVNQCDECIQHKEFKLLYEISCLMMNKSELNKKCEDVIKKLKSELYLQRGAVYLFNEDDNKLHIFSSVDLTPMQKKMGIYALGEGATGLAGESREPVVVENVYNDIMFLNKAGSRANDTISYVAVPMVVNDKLIGVMSAHLNADSNLAFEESIKVLTIVSSLIAQTVLLDTQIENEKEALKEQNNYYKQEMLHNYNFEEIVGSSDTIKKVFDIIGKVAKSKATVLIRGESGTGKELIASAVHNLSDRHDGPFIKLNCAAITETLLESELFGHEKGAFTDAKATRKGRFELADGGTLFLDEIGDISPNLQVKLLRVLQEQEFERVGGSKTVKVNVRVVAATNRNLEEMIEKGNFREDLFYRLNVIPLFLPPLRERANDLDLLVCHFLDKFHQLHKKNVKLTKEAMSKMHLYNWPGNIRELENTMERIVLMSEGNIVDVDMIDFILPSIAKKEPTPKQEISGNKILTQEDIEALEKDSIIKALEEVSGIQVKAAKMLGLTQRQLGYKIKKYEIEA